MAGMGQVNPQNTEAVAAAGGMGTGAPLGMVRPGAVVAPPQPMGMTQPQFAGTPYSPAQRMQQQAQLAALLRARQASLPPAQPMPQTGAAMPGALPNVVGQP